MNIERGGGSVNLFVPIDGPDGWLPSSVTAELALIVPGATPQPGDWHAATWQGTEARWLLNPAGYPDGTYLCKARLSAGLEQVVLTSGRVTIA